MQWERCLWLGYLYMPSVSDMYVFPGLSLYFIDRQLTFKTSRGDLFQKHLLYFNASSRMAMLTPQSRTVGVEEAVKEAQQGGSGVVIYFRKEGRALGEVTKYLGKSLLCSGFALYLAS